MEYLNNNQLELKRKILHILVGIIGIILLTYDIFNSLIIFILLIFGIFLSLLSLKYKIPLVNYFLRNFDREEDIKNLPGRGMIFSFVGALLALQLFQRNIALASITILTFSDSISYIVGKYFGKTSSLLDSRKNIEGSLAGFLVSSILVSFFVPFYLAISGSLIAMLFELLTIKIQELKIDDNLIIPLSSGTAMFLIARFLI